MQQENKNREENMRHIKNFNLMKNAVWNCVLDQEVPKDGQMVNLTLLNEVLLEIKILIQLDELKKKHAKNAEISKVEAENESIESPDYSDTKHLLKRFSVFSPITLKNTIVKCETLGLIQN